MLSVKQGGIKYHFLLKNRITTHIYIYTEVGLNNPYGLTYHKKPTNQLYHYYTDKQRFYY